MNATNKTKPVSREVLAHEIYDACGGEGDNTPLGDVPCTPCSD